VDERRFINVRKLAALDIAYRGAGRIMLESGFLVFFLGLVGLVFLLFAHGKTEETTAIGVYLVFLGLNHVPLFTYSVVIAARGSAKQEAAVELASPERYRTKYGVQRTLVLIPLAIDLLAIAQLAGGRQSPAPGQRL
jgi:hypothetical protein